MLLCYASLQELKDLSERDDVVCIPTSDKNKFIIRVEYDKCVECGENANNGRC